MRDVVEAWQRGDYDSAERDLIAALNGDEHARGDYMPARTEYEVERWDDLRVRTL